MSYTSQNTKNSAPQQHAKEESFKKRKFERAHKGNQIVKQQKERAEDEHKRIAEQKIEAPLHEKQPTEDKGDPDLASIESLRERLQARIKLLQKKRKADELTKKAVNGVKSRQRKRSRDASKEGKLSKKAKIESLAVGSGEVPQEDSSKPAPPPLPEV